MHAKKIVFVTQNKNKVVDAQNFLTNYTVDHVHFEVPEIQSLDSKEVAEFKVRYAYDKVGEPCFVWDVSLSIKSLNGFPGPLIKWFFSKSVGAEKICKIVSLFPEKECVWRTVLAYFDGSETHYFEESVEGTIPDYPRGTNGHDWDVIFVPIGSNKTLAEMTYDKKAEYAVTKKLLNKFENFLCKTNFS